MRSLMPQQYISPTEERVVRCKQGVNTAKEAVLTLLTEEKRAVDDCLSRIAILLKQYEEDTAA
jgi:hypothetical protein